ncbi:MAG: glycosyltransferase [Bacteroidia bacterium]|nr:glycosyltransferase [Bacteroidia bacterium]
MTVLNPAVHSRIFFKEALTLKGAGFAVSIIGQSPDPMESSQKGVRIIPLKPFSRLSARRFFSVPWQILRLALRERARIYVLHTPELLWLTFWLKLLNRAKIVYDVHEDYYLNIRHAGYYPAIFRSLLAPMVKLWERFWMPFLDGVVYAEACFDLGKTARKKSVLAANKFNSQVPAIILPNVPRLLFSGTIAANWGIWEALELWKKLNASRMVDLTVAGHTHDKELLDKIQQFVAQNGLKARFRLLGGQEYLPHETLLQEIAGCTLGLAFYQLRENLRERIPTKFYEFMALQKPLLFTQNPPWNALNERLGFGKAISLPISEETVAEIGEILKNPTAYFYPKTIPPAEYSWQEEGRKLVTFMQNLIQN